MRGTAKCVDGVMFYDKKVSEYIKEHEGCEFDIDVIAINKPEHYLYRYLFGILFKDMSAHTGMSIDEVHKEIKEKFALEYVNNWLDVPRRHRKKCERYERTEKDDSIKRWYIKSCSSMTHEELIEYTLQVEMHFFDFLEGAIDKKHQKEAYEMRKKGLMNDKQLKKYLEEENERGRNK